MARLQNGGTTVENNIEDSRKIKSKTTIESSNPKALKSECLPKTIISTPWITAALLTIAKMV